MTWENLPGLVLLLAAIVALVIGIVSPSRRLGWLAIYAGLFVLSDIFDLILIGPQPTPIQHSLGVSDLTFVIGRIVVIGSLGVLWGLLALEQSGSNK